MEAARYFEASRGLRDTGARRDVENLIKTQKIRKADIGTAGFHGQTESHRPAARVDRADREHMIFARPMSQSVAKARSH
jgi:1,6-anhydro-N-acetylmuramate kinase